ncbi:MAG TPA: TSUP family transporter [Rectinemataceae bacterium]|nr:TSUP family transporter [Rectinemataceae bacterium]
MHPEALTPLVFALLVLAGGAAGFVDSIAGGGGIITLPALLAVGLPPHLALGTNKLQSSFGSLTASLRYRAAGIVRFRDMVPGILATAVGAGLGAAAVGAVNSGFLRLLIPLLLLAILVFLMLRPRFGLDAGKKRISWLPFWVGAGLLLGFYDGFFGPGTGTFWAMALVGLAGLDLQGATAHTKVANFTSNLVSLAVFLAAGTVVFTVGLAMGAAEVVGAWAGSRMVLRRGAGFVRVVVLVVTGAMIAYIVLRYWVGA